MKLKHTNTNTYNKRRATAAAKARNRRMWSKISFKYPIHRWTMDVEVADSSH